MSDKTSKSSESAETAGDIGLKYQSGYGEIFQKVTGNEGPSPLMKRYLKARSKEGQARGSIHRTD